MCVCGYAAGGGPGKHGSKRKGATFIKAEESDGQGRPESGPIQAQERKSCRCTDEPVEARPGEAPPAQGCSPTT